MLYFEWDPRKAEINANKHDVSFEEASTVFNDPLSLTINDPLHSDDELRMVQIGTSRKNRVLIVVFCERDDDTVRIITARKATKKEKEVYENYG